MTLIINNLSVNVDSKQVLNNISLSFELGKNYCILGKNGSGKSSLAMTVMGHPKYEMTDESWNSISLEGEQSLLDEGIISLLQEKGIDNLNKIAVGSLEPYMRAKLGIFVAFQNIPEIKWVKLFEFLRTIYNARWSASETFLSFKKIVEPLCEQLNIERDFLWRDLNVGFSGGERRKIEILQLSLLKPRYVFLDEVDSGLDVDAFKSVSTLLSQYNTSQNCLIVITHYFDILERIPVEHVYMLDQGRLIGEGDMSMVKQVKDKGFEGY